MSLSQDKTAPPQRRKPFTWFWKFALVVLGASAGWFLHHTFRASEDIRLAIHGGSIELMFQAEDTYFPPNAMGDAVFREVSQKWTFTNRSENQIEVSLPAQEYHSIGLHGRAFIKMHPEWIIAKPHLLQPGESFSLERFHGYLDDEIPQQGTRGYMVAAFVDGELQMLGCETAIREDQSPAE